MTTTSQSPHSGVLRVGLREVPVTPAAEFLAVERRATSFISSFGDWQLAQPASDLLKSAVAHLEWFHDTGELVAFGQVPHLGHGDIEVSRSQAAVDTDGTYFGGAGGRIVHAGDGAVREWFPAMVLGADTRVAVLAVVEHGPKIHELLWGWHIEHRRPEGWDWLLQRLADA